MYVFYPPLCFNHYLKFSIIQTIFCLVSSIHVAHFQLKGHSFMNVEILVNFVTDNVSFSLFCFVQNSLSRDAPIDNCGLLFPTFCILSCCVMKGTYFVRGLLVPMIFETDYYPIKSYNDVVQNTLEYLRLENISSANYFSTVSREENQKMWHIS